ncbi:MAG: hypothetical protein M5F18_09205, partial [Asgard group archaeon]|nr:hypothetical protein [Asgard group archaeon]
MNLGTDVISIKELNWNSNQEQLIDVVMIHYVYKEVKHYKMQEIYVLDFTCPLFTNLDSQLCTTVNSLFHRENVLKLMVSNYGMQLLRAAFEQFSRVFLQRNGGPVPDFSMNQWRHSNFYQPPIPWLLRCKVVTKPKNPYSYCNLQQVEFITLEDTSSFFRNEYLKNFGD